MKPTTRTLAILPVILLFLSCQVFSPTQFQTPTPTVVADHFNKKPTYTPTPSPAPLPSYTPTPTQIPPTATQVIPPSPTQTPLSVSTQLRIFENLWNIVNDTYIYPDFNGLDWDAVHQEFKAQISSGLTNEDYYLGISNLIYRLGDNHSYFLDPQQVAFQIAEQEGSLDYVGIGVYLAAVPERDRAVILTVSPGSPALDAGLQPRDSILAVDGSPILDGAGYIRDLVRGPEGTGIDLTIQTPGGEPRQVHIVRQKITANYPVDHQVITTPDGKRIGYIFLLTFMVDSVDEQVAAAIKSMNAEGPLDGLILDNRMNEGGSSMVMEPILGYFTGGTLGHFVSRSSSFPLDIPLHNINGSAHVPLVVLVGSGTASFGEIFSGILQDFGRAYVIGTPTNGNVEILGGYDFEDGSELWLASETFKPINHPNQNWEESGIIPDLTVQGSLDQFSFEDDPVIQAAVQYLSGQ